MSQGVMDVRQLNACQYGSSGHCAAGRHDECAHRPGGAQEHGVWSPSTWLGDRHGRVWSDRGTHWAVGPWHLWRCACACHSDPQTTLGTLW